MTRVLLVSGDVDVPRLELALQALHEQVRMLQATIVTRAWGPQLVLSPPQSAPHLRIVARTDSGTWKGVAIDDVHERFEEGGTLWRATLVRTPGDSDSELIITLHHSICDGTSATWMMEWTLEIYQALTEGRNVAPVLPRSVGDASPPVQATSFGALASTIAIGWQQLQQAWTRSRTARLGTGAAADAQFAIRRTRPEFLEFDAGVTSLLVQRTRQAGARMHGTLCAALIQTVRNHGIPGPEWLTCVTNIDLRRHSGRRTVRHADSATRLARNDGPSSSASTCDDAEPRFGCGAYFVVTRHDRDKAAPPKSFWETAREASSQLWRKLGSAQAGMPHRWAGPFAAAAIRKAMRAPSHGRTQTLGVSNLGPIEFPGAASSISVRGMYSLTGQHGIGPDVTLIAATVNGRLHATLCFVEPLFSFERRQGFAAEFREHLERAADLPN